MGGCARLAGVKAVTPPEQSKEEGECTGREQYAREVPKSCRHLGTWAICVLRVDEGPRGDGTQCKVL